MARRRVNAGWVIALVTALTVGVQVAPAGAVNVPVINDVFWTFYGDVLVESISLSNAVATGNGPQKGDPFQIPSSPGQIGGDILVYTSNQGSVNDNYDTNGPLFGSNANTSKMDNPFVTPNGNQSGTQVYAMGNCFTHDPGSPCTIISPSLGNGDGSLDTAPVAGTGGVAQFAGGFTNTWDASLATIQSVLGAGNGILFKFDNNQEGSLVQCAGGDVDCGNDLRVWAQVSIWNADHTAIIACYELNNTTTKPSAGNPSTGNCASGNPVPQPDGTLLTNAPTVGTDARFVPIQGGFCVDGRNGDQVACDGAHIVDNSHPYDGVNFFLYGPISNNLGNSDSEFAAIIPDLNANLAAWAAAGNFMSIQFVMFNNNDGNEQFFLNPVSQENFIAPQPSALLLLGTAMLGLAVAQWKRRSNAHV